MFIYKAL